MQHTQARTSKPLSGKVVLVTRPRHQAAQICQLIESAGGQAVRFPLFEISDPEDISPAISLIQRLDQFDMAIFVSPNAVHKTTQLLDLHQITLPTGLQLAAIGQQTANVLRQSGYRVDIAPQYQFNSEAFLALPEVQDMEDQRVIIFRGVGGRKLLGVTLTARGAQVVYAEVYRRVSPMFTPSDTAPHSLPLDKIDLLTLTSSEAVQALHDLITSSGQVQLFKTCLLVGSFRMAEKSRLLGFTTVEWASNPSDAAMFEAILKWVKWEATAHGRH